MTTVDSRAARERKQKIFVVVGGVALLAILAIQLPRILGGSSATPEPAPISASGEDQAPAPTPSALPVALVDTDPRFAPSPAKLRSFRVFTPKDPFVQQVRPASDTPAATAGTSGTSETSEPAAPKPATDSFTADKTASPVTVIAVNGRRHALLPGAAFPTADPVFVLVANRKSTGTVTIAVARGSFANGSNRTKVTLEKPLVLVNRGTGARYRLVLLAVGTAPSSTKTAQGTFQVQP